MTRYLKSSKTNKMKIKPKSKDFEESKMKSMRRPSKIARKRKVKVNHLQNLQYDSRHAKVKIKLHQGQISNKCNTQ